MVGEIFPKIIDVNKTRKGTKLPGYVTILKLSATATAQTFSN